MPPCSECASSTGDFTTKRRIIRLNKQGEYSDNWHALKSEYGLAISQGRPTEDILVRCALNLKAALDSNQEYWTLDRPQPFFSKIVEDRLWVTLKSGRSHAIAEHAILGSFVGILADELDEVKHHTPMT